MNCAEMLRNIFQFEKGHSGIHLARNRCRDARLVLEEMSTGIELQGLRSVNDLDGNQVRTLGSKIVLHVVQRTKQRFVIFLAEHIR
jgi:hypothetical protein